MWRRLMATMSSEHCFGHPRVPALSGLHAKLYVTDDRWRSHVWTGSANATTAAFKHNIGLMVELIGKKSKCGVDVLLSGSGSTTGFVALLQDFGPSE